MKTILLSAILLGSLALGSERPLGFEEALSRIMSRSTAIAAQQANLGVATASGIPARFAFLPSLSFDANTTAVGESGGTSASTLTSSQVEAVARLNVIHWGADVASLSAASFDEESQRAGVDSVRLKTEDEAIRALVNEIQRQGEIGVNEEIVKTQERLLRIARQRYKSGYLPIQEADKVSVDLDNASASLADSRLRESEARASLENLLGTSRISLEWPWKERLAQVDADAIAGKDLNLSLRPDWRSASAKRQAEEERYQRNLRLLLPSVDASLTYGNYVNPGALYGVYGSVLSWTGVISVSLPFFDHLVSYANVRSQSQTLLAAEAALTQTERDARSDWVSAKQEFTTALGTALAREKTLATSRRIYQDGFRRFQAGRASVNDLAIDQKRLFDSELFAIQGWSSAHLAFSKLCHSVGQSVESCGK